MSIKERPKTNEQGFILVYSDDDIPDFKTDQEEHEFWDTHAFSEEYTDRAIERAKHEEIPLPPAREHTVQSKRISLTLEQDTIERLKRLARKKGMGYQTLLKSFVSERLYEEEKLEGVRRRI